MATLISNASGNLTGAATFAAAEAGAGALQLVRASGGSLGAASSVTSSTFTVTSGKVIDGALIWIRPDSGGQTGTFKIDLQKGGVSQASVTVNKADLPSITNTNNSIPPTFFKFTSTATGDGAANWTLVLTTTGTGSTSTYWFLSTSTNFTRALRTTTAATPAAGDDLYILGELTGAGIHNSITVAMDSTAATAYGNGALNTTSVAGGGIHVSNYGTLGYGSYQSSGGVLTTLDPATTFETTVSGGGLTATRTTYSGSQYGGARSVDYKSSGKYYFEVTVGSPMNGTANAVGILLSTGTYTQMENLGTNCFATVNNNDVYSNNAFQGTIGSWGAGTNLSFAIDLTARLGWVRKNGGSWNNIAGNPVAGTGGFPIAAGAFAPVLGLGNASLNDSMTANFGATAYAYTPPSGFGTWSGPTALPAAGINNILRVNGDLMVYQFGTLNIGSSAAPVVTTWNPSDKGTNVVLSNGNLASTGGTGSVRATITFSAGKYYFEVKLTNSIGNCGIGIADATFDVNGAGINTAIYVNVNGGGVWNNGGFKGNVEAGYVANDICCVAVDIGNSKIWFRRNAGNWNNDVAQNPATNAGGIVYAGMAAAVYPLSLFNGSVATLATANFGATTFAQTVPSGFSAWNSAPASTAVLEFQQASADGDFGLRCLDNSVVTITGQPRTAAKNVVKCKLTADVTGVGNTVNTTFGTAAGNTSTNELDATGNSLLATGFTDNNANSAHTLALGCANVTNLTQTISAWVARGSGTNNRYFRFLYGNSNIFTSVANGFYSDIDLQAGTAGTVTALGNGTATSVSITPVGRGYLIKMTGKVSSSVAGPFIFFAACSAPATTTYTGNTTQCFIVDHVAVVTTASISDTTFNVDTDTGWLSGDAVCVASTTRTATECEIYPLNANAGSSSFTSALYPFGGNVVSTHHGTAPVQAEIGLLTRNVKIRSTSTTLMSYVYCTALATVTASWAEFYYVGASVTNKRGIEIESGTVANVKNFSYCSIHDCDTGGLYLFVSTQPSLNVVFSNNVLWNSNGGNFILISGTLTNTDWAFDANLVMKTPSAAVSLGDIGGTLTNNTVVGSSGVGINYAENATIGICSGNTTHSNAGVGFQFAVAVIGGFVDGLTSWRNGNNGLYVNATCVGDVRFNNLTLFGNSSTNLFAAGDALTITGNNLIAGDTTFSVANGIMFSTTGTVTANISGIDMSGVGSIYAPHTSFDITSSNSSGQTLTGYFNNCKFGAPTVLSRNAWTNRSYLGFEKYNQVAGDHRTEMTFGQLKTDATIYNTAAPSMRMTPNNVSNKLQSAPLGRGVLVPVASGSSATVSVWVRKDASYSGSQPRLIQRANAALGQNSDVVLATCTDVTSAPIPAFWDGGTAALVTLSSGNLVVTNIGGTATEQGARVASTGGKTSGKYYFEVTFTSYGGGGSSGIGVGTSASTYSNLGSNGTVGAIFFPSSGNIWSNGSNVGGAGTGSTNGTLWCVAVDLDNRQIWFRPGAGGFWNNSGANNPATNTGGKAIPAGTMVPVCTFNAAGNVWTANFGATAFVGAVPSGFTSGWSLPAGQIGTNTWVQLTGTGSTATDAGAFEFIVDCDGVTGFVNLDDWGATVSTPALTTATWDPATVTAVTLSGGNLVVTNTGTTSADQGAKVANASGKTSGKYYFEVTWTTVTSGTGSNQGVGVGTFASTYTNMGNGGTTGVIAYIGGSIYSNGGNVATDGSWSTSGLVMGVAIDLDNRKAWFRQSPSGVWNNSGANNPATNVGGATIAAGTMVPFVTFGGSGGAASNVMTANFGASAFSGTVPSGFTAGWSA